MKEDRFSPPSYLYEPSRRAPDATDVTTAITTAITAAVMWAALLLVGAVEIYLAFAFVGPLP